MVLCDDFGSNPFRIQVTAQTEEFVKQSKLPEPLSKLADIPLGSRYVCCLLMPNSHAGIEIILVDLNEFCPVALKSVRPLMIFILVAF